MYTMRRLALRLVWILLIFVVAACSGFAQASDEFQSVPGGFGIKLPSCSQAEGFRFDALGQMYLGTAYFWDRPRGIFTITFGDRKTSLNEPENAHAFLADWRNKYIEQRLKANGKIIAEGSITLEGQSGYEVTEEHQGYLVFVRVLFLRNRFYTLSTSVDPKQREFINANKQALASFRFLTFEEILIRRDKLADNFAPAALPQDSVTPKEKSDAEDENLSGRVKSVFTEEDVTDDGTLSGTKTPWELDTFDSQGNLVSKVGYYGGLPLTVWNYGYLDGHRAFRKTISKSATATQCRKEADPKGITESVRSLQFKYDSGGQPSEMKIFQEQGRLEEEYIYKKSGLTRETDYTGSFTNRGYSYTNRWKSVVTLDGRGNPIEEARTAYTQHSRTDYYVEERTTAQRDMITGTVISDPTRDSPVSTGALLANPNKPVRVIQPMERTSLAKTGENHYEYTYKYDSHGNWIERITAKVVKTKSGNVEQTTKATYRTITYY
jgi:hypothetical protein